MAISMGEYLEKIMREGSRRPDNTQKSVDFYFNHWKVLSKNKDDFEPSRGDKFYRGDCILSVKTVLGNEGYQKDSPNNWRLMRSIENDGSLTSDDTDKLIQKAERYRYLFDTLANFMPMWKLGGNNSTNLNMAKGNWRTYRDFPDLWLRDIMLWYNGPIGLERKNMRAYELFIANKENYFDRFGSWEEYIDNNYLGDFVNKDYEVLELFEGDHCPRSGILELSQIEDFLDNGIRIIEARAKRLVERIANSFI